MSKQHVEHLPISDFEIVEHVQSKISKSHRVRNVVGLYCPRCLDTIIKPMPEHGDNFTCPICKLAMCVRGASLVCSIDMEDTE